MSMSVSRKVSLSLVLLGCLVSLSRADDLRALDERTLADAGLATDGPALLAYLRGQTPNAEELARLEKAVQQLGHRSFSVREKAQQTVVRAGRPALRFLKQATSARDLELARRAERCMEEIERVPYVSVLCSLARLLGELRPESTVESVLAYLPSAGEEAVEQALLETLLAAGVSKDKVHPALKAALKDSDPVRRGAAAFVHGRAESPALDLLTPLLRDPDPVVRLRTAEALVSNREKSAVPVLIALLSEAPAHHGWRAEDLLLRIAGDTAPTTSLNTSEVAARRQCQEAWETWFHKQGESIDLAKVNFADVVLGVTLYSEYDGSTGNGRVWLAGPDNRVRWEITGLQGPNDARLLPGGRVLIAERNSNRVTERDQKGKILWERRTEGSAIAVDRLPNGNTLITTWTQVLEVTRDNRTLWSYTHVAGFRYAYRLPGGNILGIGSNGQVVELDARGRQLQTITPAQHGHGAGYWGSVERIAGGRYLLALGSSRKVVEIDNTGKILWSAEVPNAVFATRLRNGHTLVCNFEDRQVVELDRTGKEVNKQTLSGRPFTARRY